MKWYKRDPDAAIAGMVGLTPEERGIYNTIIDLLYSRDGDLPDDERFFARACGCAPQMWRRIRDQLLAKGKIHYKTPGKLTANRVDNELISAKKLIDKMTFLGELSSKNKDAPPAARATQPHPHPQPEKKKRETSSLSLPADFSPDRNEGKKRGWPEEKIDLEIQRFRDHASMKDRKCKNWNAAWRNWVTSPYQENGNGRPLHDDSRSASRAAARLAEAAERGEFTFGPRPSLLPEPSADVVRLLPKR